MFNRGWFMLNFHKLNRFVCIKTQKTNTHTNKNTCTHIHVRSHQKAEEEQKYFCDVIEFAAYNCGSVCACVSVFLMPFAKLPENQFTLPNSVTYTHTHTYIQVTHTHTHLKLRLKKRRVTRICRYDVRVLQEGQSTERSAQRKELLSTEIKGAVQSRTKRRIKKRERERERRTGQNASSPKSRSNISLSHCARSLSASLAVKLAVWVSVYVRVQDKRVEHWERR